MGALGHFLESEGIATTQISLIYEHTAAIRPSRALWVPFELGRPLGIPNDPIFQKRVLTAALDLLAEKSGPILAEYPEPAPSRPDSEEPWVCPVNLGSPKSDVELADTVSEVLGEISELSPWFELGRDRRGRSVFGVSQLNIQDCARFLASLLASENPDGGAPDVSLGESLKRTSEDVFAWYTEAAVAQPGALLPSSRALEDWYWDETAASRLMLDLAQRQLDHPDPLVRRVIERNLIPWTQKHRLKKIN